MLGGGTFTAQNKALPGTYINFVSAASASASLGERGYAALALPLKWGVDGAVFAVTGADFRKKTEEIFGFAYDSEDAKGLRDLFKNITTLYCYKLMNGGAKASNSISQAKHKGSVGAKLSTEILTGTVDGTFDLNVYLGTKVVFSATVSDVAELATIGANPWVDWTIETLAATAKAVLQGDGLDGEAVTAAEHSAFLTAVEPYSFNALGCLSTEGTIKELYVQATKEARDENGVKYQLVVFDKAANYEGVVNVKNTADAVWWTLGVIAGCAVNASNTNKIYDGEFDIPTNYTKAQLEAAINAGEFTFHKVGDTVRVLTDINSLTTTTAEKGEDFKSNQTIRVLDQIATDIAKVFNDKYLGVIPNDASGRVSLWADIVKHHEQLQQLRAIENFDPASVVVEAGDTKKSVVVNDAISVVNAMEKLYMSVVVS